MSIQFIFLYHKSKKETFILRLDFEKAVDKIEHHVIIIMMQAKGMSNRWISWEKQILTSGTSYVLVYGVPGKRFQCKRAVKQEDPLSPLLLS